MRLPVEIENLSKMFPGKKNTKVEALRELSFSIDVGEVFGFLGPNGAGKSTTIKILMGLLAPTAGKAFLFGKAVTMHDARRSIGYLPENPAFYDFLSAREYLWFVGKAFAMDTATIAARTESVLDELGILDAASRQIRSYSKGMVQRLGIAQTLLHDPDLYILDEPMSGLDPVGRALVKDVIKRLKSRGKTVFFSTHITADVEALCDRLGIIVKGRLEALDRVENILRSGIEGYIVEVSSGSPEAFGDFTPTTVRGSISEFSIPKARFDEFASMLSRCGGKVELIETKRKDLEKFFLDIVTHDV
jgi:ABC-2 type transport system ATP-binding protein